VRIPTDTEEGWIVLGPVHDGLRDPRAQRLLVTAAALIGTAVRRDELLREANEAAILREGERLRTVMLNAVSHDLRSPLSSMIAAAESLLQTDVNWSTEERREFLSEITSEGRRLARMVDHLLDYSRVESGALHLAPAWVDPGESVLQVVSRLRPLVRDHVLTVDVPPQMEAALLDEIAIGEVIANLIENAARHTPPGTNILVRARRPAASFEVVVEDDGPGIPLAALPSIFEPFMGTRRSGTARTSGLGLAIVRGIVEAHGGSIRAEQRRGGGARFTLTLVQRQPPTAPDEEIER
jgi:two-component system sensor histidine kinase KdpD